MGDGVENAEIGRGVRAAARDPLPAGAVVGEVGVEESVPEPVFAVMPVEEQVFNEERADDHAHAVVHIASLPELAHAGIDDGVAGLAALPCFESLGVVSPGEGIEFGLQVYARDIGEVVEEVV